MSTSIQPKHRSRHLVSRCFAYAAALLFLAFVYFLVSDFGDNKWPVLGFAAITSLIVANTVSHSGSGSDSRKPAGQSDERD